MILTNDLLVVFGQAQTDNRQVDGKQLMHMTPMCKLHSWAHKATLDIICQLLYLYFNVMMCFQHLSACYQGGRIQDAR